MKRFMKRFMFAMCALACVVSRSSAQGRGGRSGGPPGPPVMRCLNPNIPVATQITKGTPVAQQFGVDPNNGIIIMRPDGDASLVIQPCANFAQDDPFAKFLFPPDLVMSHQQEIGLTDAQRAALQQAVVAAQTAMVTSQLRTAGEVEKLQKLLQAPTVDEARTLDEIDRILALEREVKRAQLGLMIRVKNLLTPQQQEALTRIRGD
jgi:hypothetical protein